MSEQQDQLGLVGASVSYEVYRGYVAHYALRRVDGDFAGIAKILPGRRFDELRYATGDGVRDVTLLDIEAGRLTLVEDDEAAS